MVVTARDVEIKQGYKRTEIGVMPKDWAIKKLSMVVQFTNGKAHEQFIDDMGDYIVVNSKFISTDGRVIKYSKKSLSPLFSSDIAMVMSDIPNGKALAKCFIVRENGKYTLNQRICSFRVYDSDAQYLFYQLNRNQYFLDFDGGVGQTNLRASEVLDCLIPLPPLPEQQAIATALSDIDALITSLDKLIVKKRDIKQATMQQLLTGKVRLPGFSGEWDVRMLGEILRVCHGKSQHDVVVDDGKYPILATSGEIGRANNYLYNKPSVLIGRKGTIDSPQYMDSPFWTIDTLFYTEISDRCNPKFVFYLFNMIDWLRHNEASGVPSLNASTIENIEIHCPPLAEQRAIATILTDMDNEITALERKRDKTRALKQSMMQELLTGKTRLI